jgi:hypothetical protein
MQLEKQWAVKICQGYTYNKTTTFKLLLGFLMFLKRDFNNNRSTLKTRLMQYT